MNCVQLIGNLTRDPEVRYTNKQMAIATFSIAINRPPKQDGTEGGADYPRITVFGKQAENCEKFLHKGSKVGITGKIQTGSYEKDGQKVYTTDVVADRVEFLGRPADQEQPAVKQVVAGDPPTPQMPSWASRTTATWDAVQDDDIPF